MEEKRNLRKTIGLILIVIGIILISISTFMIITKNNNKNNEKSKNIDKTDTIKKVSDVDMQTLFSETFMLKDNDYVVLYKNKDVANYTYHNKYSSLFGKERVEFDNLFDKDTEKLELAHIVSGLGYNGTFRVDILKGIYEKLFGGNSFKPMDYTVNQSMTCTIENESVICGEGINGGPGSCNAMYVKYVDGKQIDDNLIIDVYVVDKTNDCQSYQSRGIPLNDLNGVQPADLFTSKYIEKLEDTKYHIVYKIDKSGSKLLYAEPA